MVVKRKKAQTKGKRIPARKITKSYALKGSDFPSLTNRQLRFLNSFAELGSLTSAADLAGLSRQNHYRWIADPDYLSAFNIAREVGIEILESAAKQRALAGR